MKVLFYTDRTEGYQGQKIKGVDRIVKADGDFFVVFLRAMPHQADPTRMTSTSMKASPTGTTRSSWIRRSCNRSLEN